MFSLTCVQTRDRHSLQWLRQFAERLCNDVLQLLTNFQAQEARETS